MSAGCPLCGGPLPDDGIYVDFDGGMVVGRGHVAALTRSEFRMFEALWNTRPRMLNKEQLLAATSGYGDDDREIKLVDVFVCKLRRKLRGTGIVIDTVWGEGYRIVTRGQRPAVAAINHLREAS